MLCAVQTIGERLKAARKQIRPRFTQDDLAAAMNVDQSAVSKWETGETTPDAVQLIQIARVLKSPIEDLVVGIDPTYDRWRRDLVRHDLSGGSPPHQGGSGVPESTQARIKELKEREQKYKNLVAALEGVERTLSHAMSEVPDTVRAENAASRVRQPKARQRHRKTG